MPTPFVYSAQTMEMYLLVLVTSGLLVLQTTPVQAVQTDRCSYAGVVHLSSSSLSFQEALQLCQSLSYSLATQEQLTEACNKGLRTNRYGWIDGQKIAIVHHNDDFSCTPVSGEISSHAKANDSVFDVFCFSTSEVSCKDAIISTPRTPVSSPAIQKSMTTTSAKPDPDKDIFDEVIADGYIVDSLPVKNEKLPERYNTATTPNSNAGLDVTEKYTTTKPTTTETIREDMNVEGSGMNPETFNHEKTRLLIPTPVHSLEREIGQEDGSGQTEDTPSYVFTTKPTTTPGEAYKSTEDSQQDLTEDYFNEDLDQVTAVVHLLPVDMDSLSPDPTTSARAEEGTPGWLIIFAFCLTLGAILCVFAAIATKDKWYGPSRRSQKQTPREPSEEYTKEATLPLSEKEQELITLMNTGNEQKTDKDFTAISLEEPPEKEYLM